MRSFNIVIALFALLLSACAGAPKASKEVYPPWLDVQPGYAETCIDDGGCVPMSKRELQEVVNAVQQQMLQYCARSRT